MAIEDVLIGSDCELFVKDKSSGEIVSAEGYAKGSKHAPYNFSTESPFYATQLDNVLFEFNIPPAKSADEFVRFMLNARNFIDAELPEEYVSEAIGAARLDHKWLQTPNAKRFGCDPALNCWDMSVSTPIADEAGNLRSAGFHIHVGYKNPFDEQNRAIAKALDLFLGVPSVLKEPVSERRKLGYGLAGNFRNQKHGCEYRVLSSWFSSTPELIKWCYMQTMQAVYRINERTLKGLNDWGDQIQSAINTETKGWCEHILNQFNVEY